MAPKACKDKQLGVLLLTCLGGLLAVGAQSTAAKVFYVKPSEDKPPCPEPCHTLDEYVQNASMYFVSNTLFKFLPGEHNLTQPWRISGPSNLALVGISAGHANITCHCNGNITFTTISNFTMEGLTFVSACIGKSTLTLTDLLDATLLNCDLINWMLRATNIVGYSSITNVFVGSISFTSSPVEFLYSDSSTLSLPDHAQLNITECIFLTYAPIYSLPEFSIPISLLQSTYTVSVNLEGSAVSTDLGFHVESDVPIANSIIIKEIHNPYGLVFTGTNFSDTLIHVSNCRIGSVAVRFVKVTIEDSLLYIQKDPSSLFTAEYAHSSVLKNVTIAYQDIGQVESNYDFRMLLLVESTKYLSFIDCKFLSIGESDDALGNPWATVVLLSNSNGINFTNCEFSNNMATVISAVNSNFILSDFNVFSNNTAYQGGAMAFYGSSYVTLANSSHTHFVNNSAETVGGAVFVDYGVRAACFFDFQVPVDRYCLTTNVPAPGVSLTFVNNTAMYGGNNLYGASLDTCTISEHYDCDGWNYVSTVFQVNDHQENGSDISAISSKPLRACLCEDGRPSCTRVFSHHTLYPGDTLVIPAVVVGDRFGTVDGSVYAHVLLFDSREVMAELGDLQHSQSVGHKCRNLSYTVLSNRSTATLALTASSVLVSRYPDVDTRAHIQNEITRYQVRGIIESPLQWVPVYINITLLPCPLGFILSGDKPRCTCDPQLLRNHLSCNITTQSIQRNGTQWVGSSYRDNSSCRLIVSRYCPNHYCNSESVDVHLDHPDTQCSFDHSGILCGGCQPGLSLALGSPQCLSCSNTYLALLVPFAVAGIALVFFIKLLNLTVAVGTLNGLIFYANIFRANQATWMPGHSTNILTVFIAWLNLDLGIETCFFDGLDGYWMTWLQFVFPFYIWAIVIMIILLSRCFSPVAKIFGNNSVPVLATLFLLCYPKLLRTIISVFHPSTLEYGNCQSGTVWSYDGNVTYLGSKHVALFIVALAGTLFLWLPYTVALTFAQCFQKIPSDRVNVDKVFLKLKPFMDAYFGPFKDKHRYWVGLLLLIRGLLFLAFAVTPTSDSNVDLLVVLVVVICLQTYLGYVCPVYKNAYLSLLESSFFVNLGILAGGTLYVRASGGNQTALAYTSVSVAFAQFVAIVAAHAITSARDLKMCYFHKYDPLPQTPDEEPGANDDDDEGENEEPETIVINRPAVQGTVVRVMADYSQYREPVLDHLDT